MGPCRRDQSAAPLAVVVVLSLRDAPLAVLASGSRAGIISLVAVAMIGAFVWLRSRRRHDANGRSNGKWHRQPWLAGVLAILLLALLGWAAQHAFSRDTADASLASVWRCGSKRWA